MSRRHIAMLAAGAVFLVAAWYVFLWSPKGAQLDDAKSDKATAEAATEVAEARLTRLEGAASRRGEIEATKVALDAAVPEKSDLAPLILEINDTAARSGVTFVSVSPSPPAASTFPGAPPTIGLGVQLQGGYFPVLAFMHELMSFDRLVVVDGISLSPAGGDGDLSDVSVSLTARAFTNQEPAK